MSSGATEFRRLAAIMFTDIVGYSALAQRNEAAALDLLEEHRQLLRRAFLHFQGREIKTMGDGFLVEFSSALAAVQCAIGIQENIAARNSMTAEDRNIQLRIGIHVGDVVLHDNDLVGDGVNIAARLEPLAEPGGICISEDVARLIQNKIDHRFVQFGPAELKNIELPVVIYKIELEGKRVARPRARKRSLSMPAARWWVVGGALVVLAGAIWEWFYLDREKAPAPKSVQAQPALKSVAVLPFTNLSPDGPADEYISDGLTEHLIMCLSQLKGLRVPSRSSVFALKGENLGMRALAERLGVQTILEGSVQKAGTKLRITTQLIHAADDSHLWATNYDREISDIFDIQNDVASNVIQALNVTLLRDEQQRISQKPTENLAAYDLYLKGRYLANKRSPEELRHAIQCFEQAVQQDETFALGYAGLADANILLSLYAAVPSRDTMARALEAVGLALRYDEKLAAAHTCLGSLKMTYEWDWAGAEREFQRALELDARYAPAYQWHALYWSALEEWDAAVESAQMAVRLDPASALILYHAGNVLGAAGRTNESAVYFEQALQLEPDFVPARQWLAVDHLISGRTNAALREIEAAAARTRPQSRTTRAISAFVYARLGEKEKAAEELEALLAQRSASYAAPVDIAIVYCGLNDTERAMQWLETAREERDPMLCFVRTIPQLRVLQGHPRFGALLAGMNMPVKK